MAEKNDAESDFKEKRIKLYVVEEQEILCQAYKATFLSEPAIDIVGIVGGKDGEAIVSDLAELNPDVMILGTKMLQSDTIEKLEIIRRHHPDIGVILLAALYDGKGMKQLREFVRKSSKGCAFLLKHSIDRTEQLVQVIRAVTEGQVIIDPLVKEGLIGISDVKIAFLNDLTHREVDLIRASNGRAASLNGLTRRELEVLSWMAKEMKNTAIAEVLCVDPMTVKCHINSIYGKLSEKFGSKHPRVSAIMLYLKAIGKLSGDEPRRESPLPHCEPRRIEYANLCLS